MVEGCAHARFNRKLNTRTTISAARLNLKFGEEVDFYKDEGPKDSSGWYGPAEVVDLRRVDHGAVTLKYDKKDFEVKLQGIRRHLHLLILLAAAESRALAGAWKLIRSIAESLAPRMHINLGYVKDKDSWGYAAINRKFPGGYGAAKHLADNYMHFPVPVTVRIGNGVGTLPGLSGYSGATTVLWKLQWTYVKIIEQTYETHERNRSLRFKRHFRVNWTELRAVQFLYGKYDQVPDNPQRSIKAAYRPAQSEPHQEPEEIGGPLSPTEEESSIESDDDLGQLSTYLLNEDPELQKEIEAIRCETKLILEYVKEPAEPDAGRVPFDERLPLELVIPLEDNAELFYAADPDSDAECELEIPYPITKTLGDKSEALEGKSHDFKRIAKNGTRRAVVKRDDDILTTEDLRQNWEEVKAARLLELKT